MLPPDAGGRGPARSPRCPEAAPASRHPGLTMRSVENQFTTLQLRSRQAPTRKARSFSFFRVFSVISVPPWSIFISMGAPQAHVTLMMTRIKELGRYLNVRTVRTGQTSPLNFHPNYQDPAESVRWVNLRLLENPAAGAWVRRRMTTCVASPPVQFLTLAAGFHCFAGCRVPFPVRQNIPLRTYVSCRFRRIRNWLSASSQTLIQQS